MDSTITTTTTRVTERVGTAVNARNLYSEDG
jgi:hypothetical protein